MNDDEFASHCDKDGKFVGVRADNEDEGDDVRPARKKKRKGRKEAVEEEAVEEEAVEKEAAGGPTTECPPADDDSVADDDGAEAVKEKADAPAVEKESSEADESEDDSQWTIVPKGAKLELVVDPETLFLLPMGELLHPMFVNGRLAFEERDKGDSNRVRTKRIVVSHGTVMSLSRGTSETNYMVAYVTCKHTPGEMDTFKDVVFESYHKEHSSRDFESIQLVTEWYIIGIELDPKYRPKRGAKLAAIDYSRVTHVGQPQGTEGNPFSDFFNGHPWARPFSDLSLELVKWHEDCESAPKSIDLVVKDVTANTNKLIGTDAQSPKEPEILELLALALPKLIGNTTESVPEPLELTPRQQTLFDKHKSNLLGHLWALRVLKGKDWYDPNAEMQVTEPPKKKRKTKDPKPKAEAAVTHFTLRGVPIYSKEPGGNNYVYAKGKKKKISREVYKDMSSNEIDNYYIAITSIPGQKKPDYFPYDRNNDGRLNSTIASFKRENQVDSKTGKAMTAAPLSRAPEPASPAKKSHDADQLAKFANTMILDHNKMLEHHDESNTLSLETIMERIEDSLKWAFKDDADAEDKAQKIVTKIKGGMHYKQLQKPTPLIDYITPDCDRTAENPHALASPFRAMRRSEDGQPKALAIAPHDDRMEQID